MVFSRCARAASAILALLAVLVNADQCGSDEKGLRQGTPRTLQTIVMQPGTQSFVVRVPESACFSNEVLMDTIVTACDYDKAPSVKVQADMKNAVLDRTGDLQRQGVIQVTVYCLGQSRQSLRNAPLGWGVPVHPVGLQVRPSGQGPVPVVHPIDVGQRALGFIGHVPRLPYGASSQSAPSDEPAPVPEYN